MSRVLTGPQKAALKNIVNGRESGWGLSGRSAFGGHTRTMVSLYKAGFVDKNYEITQAGRDALQRKPEVES